MLYLLIGFILGVVVGGGAILIIRNKSQRLLTQSFLEERNRNLKIANKACEQAWQDGYDAAQI